MAKLKTYPSPFKISYWEKKNLGKELKWQKKYNIKAIKNTPLFWSPSN